MLILGVDAGNYEAKVAGPYGVDKYRTAICDWFERDIKETFGHDDMEFEIDGRKGFAGSIAAYEDVFGESMYGDSKAHEDTKIRVLLAIYRYLQKYAPSENRVSIVTGQPIASHKESEKKRIHDMLKGRHEFIVNGKKQIIHIENIGIAAEGAGAFWSNPQSGLVRILDVGSGTVNAATINEDKYINTSSDTFNFGMETINRGLPEMARGIIRGTTRLKWHRNDLVMVCGGIAEEITPFIREHYTNAETMSPMLIKSGSVLMADPVYANAIGYYELAKDAFK